MVKCTTVSFAAVLVAGMLLTPPLAQGASGAMAAGGALPSTIGKQLAELQGSDTIASAYFGHAVAVSGTSAVVGALNTESGVGRAYVFANTTDSWTQVAELKGSNAPDGFGAAVSISGDTAAVGAPYYANEAGRVWVFSKTTSGWKPVAELKGADTASHDLFGLSIGVSGNTIVVGSEGYSGFAGRTYVFTRSTSSWKQTAELKISTPSPQSLFGMSVAISGVKVVVGAPGSSHGVGRAYIFSETGLGWKQVAQLAASDAGSDDQFGSSVAIAGTTAVVGALNPTTPGGGAYVFRETANGWKQVAELKGSTAGGAAGDQIGTAVAISGEVIIVGGFDHDENTGTAEVFVGTQGNWSQTVNLRESGTTSASYFGTHAVAVSGTTALVGSPARSSGKGTGRAFVFNV
jgi:hypothetical protein